MKKAFKILPIMMLVFLMAGCGRSNLSEVSERSIEQPSITEPVLTEEVSEDSHAGDAVISIVLEAESTDMEAETPAGIESVEISFDYIKMPTHASNQIAVWIEDASGQIIKNIYGSDFTVGRRGYEKRADALNHWVAAENPAALSDEEIDTISSATLQAGSQSFVWDLTDGEGKLVPDGRYYVRLEATLLWSSNVLFTGEIDLPGDAPGEIDVRIDRSEPENTENENMIQNVRMIIYDRT